MLNPGTRIGPYEVIASIGAGGMGEVFRARDTRLGRDVAVKVLPAEYASDPGRLRRFEQEARAVAALSHPNILAVFDVGSAPMSAGVGAGLAPAREGARPSPTRGEEVMVHYLVTELLEGKSLRDRLKDGGLTVRKAVETGIQIAHGIAAAHEKGIVHRDLKPGNVFVTKDGHVKVLDFGIAKLTRPDPGPQATTLTPEPSTDTGAVLGTVGYMSPEQVKGLPTDHRTDIFSFGCVLYEMLSGRSPFHKDTTAEIMAAILHEEPPDLVELGKEVPPGLARLVRHCLEKEPPDRFQSARDVAFDLESLSQTTPAATGPLRLATARKRMAVGILGLALLGLCAAVFFLLGERAGQTPPPSFQRLTFRRGAVTAARFAPDGRTVVYSAEWDGAPAEVFSVRLESPESRPFGYERAHLAAVASSGDLALVRARSRQGFLSVGTLAQAPFSGGTPRDLEERIVCADFSPDGREMAVVRGTDTEFRLEYPVGAVLARSSGFLSHARISPDGRAVAFVDHPYGTNLGGSIAVIDRAGRKKTLAAGLKEVLGLAWSPNGREIWFGGMRASRRGQLRAVALDGREHVVLSNARYVFLEDVARDGRVLVTVGDWRSRIFFRGEGDATERELSWFDWSVLSDLSPDGTRIAFSEAGEGTGAEEATGVAFVRATSGAAPVKLGPGAWPHLSPDGQHVVAVRRASTPVDRDAIVIYPLGPGQETTVPIAGFAILSGGLLSDGRMIWFSDGRRFWLTDLSGSKPHPVTPEGSTPIGIAPDGAYAVARSGGTLGLYPLNGGEARRLAGGQQGERIAGFAADGRSLFLFRGVEIPVRVFRVDPATGRRELVRQIMPADRAGLGGAGSPIVFRITPDGKSYAYTTTQVLSDLFVIEGLR